MEFTCINCGDKTFTTLRGWKQHMSRTHGGYGATDIAAATAAAGGDVSEENVSSRMQQFISTLGGEPGAVGMEGDTPAESESPKVSVERPPATRTVKATPKKLKKILGAIPAKLLEASGITLDEEDQEAMDEAGEFMTDIFGFEFEVPAEKRVLHNRAWALVWVFGVAGMIYLKHHFGDLWKKLAEEYQKNKEKKEEEVSV